MVASLFTGDGSIDTYVMWKQHEFYDDALRIVVVTCQEYAQLAKSLAGDPSERLDFMSRLKYSTLRQPLYILAAAWRFKHEIEVRQMRLPGCNPWGCSYHGCQLRIERGMQNASECPMRDCACLRFEEEPHVAGHWLNWLREEVRSWIHRPYLIDSVMQVLKNENSLGYQSEHVLCWNLVNDFPEVPWRCFFYVRLRDTAKPHVQLGR